MAGARVHGLCLWRGHDHAGRVNVLLGRGRCGRHGVVRMILRGRGHGQRKQGCAREGRGQTDSHHGLLENMGRSRAAEAAQ
jgi:hypothetical protein